MMASHSASRGFRAAGFGCGRGIVLSLLVLVAAALFGAAPAMAAGGDTAAVRRLPGTDLPGFDYRTLRDLTIDDCEAACRADGTCRAFTFNTKVNWCFLKSDAGQPKAFRDAVSGLMPKNKTAAKGAADKTATGGKPAATPLPLPDIAFLPRDAMADADAFRARMTAAVRLQRDAGEIAADLAAGTVQGGSTKDWLALSRQLLGENTDDYDRRYALRRDGLSAALIGLRVATTRAEQAAALAQTGEAFAVDERWRPAIDSLKASLALAPSPAVSARYKALRDDYGFRVLDYTVDANAASPRMCVQFSEDLPKGRTDMAKYVSLAGTPNPAVTVSGQELCIDGLTHGARYDITLRAGIPSVVGETLQQPVTYTIYVRDRAPAVRFPSAAYVLPRTGARGVPVISVNSDGVALDLLWVGDRSLARTIVGGDFRRQLSPYEIEELASDKGARVWSGEMDVKRELNREVTTAFPVDQAAERLRPGIYVLVARPREVPPENWEQRATQWFIVSDLGLAAVSSSDGIHAFVRSLGNARPVANVQVHLIARNDEVLGTVRTDSAGHALFPAALAAGKGGMAPALITAEADSGDYAFLDLSAPGFDLSDRGVAGRAAPGPLDAFVYADRGVYRAGETVHLSALLRDGKAKAVPGVPLTLVFSRPDGVIYRRMVVADEGLGGRSADLDLIPAAQRGTWRVEAFADPKAPAIGSTTFLVEDFLPERLKLSLSTTADSLAAGRPAAIAVDASYLYGTPAAGLGIEGDVVIKPAESLAGFPGYRFGLADDGFTPVRRPLYDLGRLDAQGKATVSVPLPALEATTRLLEADIALRVREPGGRAVEENISLPVRAAGPRIGVRPLFTGDQVSEGATASFEVAAISPENKATTLDGVSWQLLRVNTSFQWFNRDGAWDYYTTTSTERVAEGRLDLAAGSPSPARISAPVTFGRYRLEVTRPGMATAATSMEFSAGWVSLGATSETPDMLEVGLDKPGYKPGETAQLTIAPHFPGTALIAVVGDGVRLMKAVDVPAAGTRVPLKVDADWRPGTYVAVMLYRPMDVAAGRMPARAIGLDWLGIDESLSRLAVGLDVPKEVRPRGPMTVPVSVTGLRPGQEAYVTVAAVDAGILNLTHYLPPDATTYFFGQRRLGAEIRDLYGALIDSLGAVRGAIRTGGDESAAFAPKDVPTQELLARFAGPVRVGADGKASVTFDLPAFNGQVKVMAVAWSEDKVGNAAADVTVRDPVVVTGSLPRVLAPGDKTRLRLDFDNVSGPAGGYPLKVHVDGPVRAGAVEPLVHLDEKGRAALDIPLTATGTGIATISVALSAPDGVNMATMGQVFRLNVRPAAAAVTRRSVEALAKGDTVTIGADRLAGLVPDGASLSFSVSAGLGLDVPGLLALLDRYPYGCAEQTTSIALPLLYFDAVADSIGLSPDKEARARVDAAIARLLQFQSPSGAFGLWGPGAGDLWLNAFVTDFMTRARAAGHAVPDGAFSLALDRLQNDLSYAQNFEAGQGGGVAYALYVLARNGRASIGDLRYFADDRINDFGSGLSQAQIGAGLALYGDEDRARKTFAVAAETLAADSMGMEDAAWSDFGTPARNTAAALALVAESGMDAGALPGLADTLAAARAGGETPTTQEAAWMLVAANALGPADKALRTAVNGTPVEGAVFRRLTRADLAAAPVSLANKGADNSLVAVTVTGVPEAPLPAAANGLRLARDYFTLDGNPANPGKAKQNDRFVVVLTVTADEPGDSNLLITDLMPGGFEVENPALVSSADLAGFPWLPQTDPAHVEFRDDRFVAAFEPGTDLTRGVTVAYMVRAVSPGSFAQPAASAEDMYRPERFARTAPGIVTVSAR